MTKRLPYIFAILFTFLTIGLKGQNNNESDNTFIPKGDSLFISLSDAQLDSLLLNQTTKKNEYEIKIKRSNQKRDSIKLELKELKKINSQKKYKIGKGKTKLSIDSMLSMIKINNQIQKSVIDIKSNLYEKKLITNKIDSLSKIKNTIDSLEKLNKTIQQENKKIVNQISNLNKTYPKDSLNHVALNNKRDSLHLIESKLFNIPYRKKNIVSKNKTSPAKAIDDQYISLNLPYNPAKNSKILNTLPPSNNQYKLLKDYCRINNNAYKYMQAIIDIKNTNLTKVIYEEDNKAIVDSWRSKYHWVYRQFENKIDELKNGTNSTNNPFVKHSCN